MDYRSLVNKLEAIESRTHISEATAPTVFKPTHFHKGNLGNKNPVMQTPDGNWWHETTGQGGDGGPSGTQIVPWQGNTENRSSWNPASIDGVITPEGKYIDFPEGVSWKQYKEKQDSDSRAALLAKLKQLIELVDKYLALKAKRGSQGAGPASTPESKLNISQSLIESFGYSTQVEAAAAIPAGAAGASGVLSKVAGRALPGVGAALGAQGAYDSYKKGDYLGAALNGLSGAFSLVPGVGWIPALGFGAWQAGRELSGATDKFNDKELATQQSGRPAGNADPKVLAIQKKILAKDPKALPQHGADGIMGPETQAAMARLKIQENTIMTQPKSLAESIRELQQKLDKIATNEADGDQQAGPTGPAVKAIPPTPEEQALLAQAQKIGGTLGKDKDGNVVIITKDGQIVSAEGELMTKQGDQLVGTGQEAPDPTNGLSESGDALEEAFWSNLLKGAANIGKNFSSGLRGGKTVQQIGPSGQFGKIAPGGRAAQKAGAALGKNPVKAATGVGAAGLAGGYAAGAAGSDIPTTPTPTPATGQTGGQSGQGGQTTPPAEDDAEMKALRAQIDALIKDLSTSQDPAIQKGLADINAKLK